MNPSIHPSLNQTSKVVVVDPNETIVRVFQSVLHAGHKLVSVSVVDEATQIVKQENPDMVMLDDAVSETDRRQIIEFAKHLNPEIKIGLISAQDLSDQCDVLLQKPLQIDRVKAVFQVIHTPEVVSDPVDKKVVISSTPQIGADPRKWWSDRVLDPCHEVLTAQKIGVVKHVSEDEAGWDPGEPLVSALINVVLNWAHHAQKKSQLIWREEHLEGRVRLTLSIQPWQLPPVQKKTAQTVLDESARMGQAIGQLSSVCEALNGHLDVKLLTEKCVLGIRLPKH